MILKVSLVMAGTLKSAKIIYYYYQRLASKYYRLKMARPFAVGLLGWRDLEVVEVKMDFEMLTFHGFYLTKETVGITKVL